LFIIWGFGKKTVKSYGLMPMRACGRCNNQIQCEILKVTTWFTLFFIPIIPYRTERFLVCPICRAAQEVAKEDFERLLAMLASGEMPAAPDTHANQAQPSPQAAQMAENLKYAGKTPTQIEYLKQMEAAEQERAAQNQDA